MNGMSSVGSSSLPLITLHDVVTEKWKFVGCITVNESPCFTCMVSVGFGSQIWDIMRFAWLDQW